MDSWNTKNRVSRVQSDVGLSRRQWKKGSSIGCTRDSRECQTLVQFQNPRVFGLARGICKPSIMPSPIGPLQRPSCTYWQLMATYSAESCLKNYCDDVSNKVHSVTTAVVAVSTARHHFVSWKDYPVGPCDGASRWGFTTGHIEIWLTGRSTKHGLQALSLKRTSPLLEGV